MIASNCATARNAWLQQHVVIAQNDEQPAVSKCSKTRVRMAGPLPEAPAVIAYKRLDFEDVKPNRLRDRIHRGRFGQQAERATVHSRA